MFLVEMAIKLLGLGVRDYLRDGFNCFDGILVIISMVEIAISSDNMQGLLVLRAFRLFRVFKLAKSWKSLRNMITTVL